MSIQPMLKGTRIVTNSATDQHSENVREYEILSVISQGGSGIVYSAALQRKKYRDLVILKEYYPAENSEKYERIGGVIRDKQTGVPCCMQEHYLVKALQEYDNCDGAAGSGGTRNITIGHVDQVEFAVEVTEPEEQTISVENTDWVPKKESALGVFAIMHQTAHAYSLPDLIRQIYVWCNSPKMRDMERKWTLSLLSEDKEKLSPYGCILAFEQIVQATGVMHRNDWVHEDIKPENMLFIKQPNSWTSLLVQFIDFGSAQPLLPEDAHPLRHAALDEKGRDRLTGTSPGYRPPELRREDYYGWTEPADFYQCGAVLYYMLCGVFPPRKNGVEANDWKLSSELDSLCNWEGREDVRSQLLDILLKSTQSDPENRYSDASELMEDIRDVRWKLSPEADKIKKVDAAIKRRRETPPSAEYSAQYALIRDCFGKLKAIVEQEKWFQSMTIDQEEIEQICALDTDQEIGRLHDYSVRMVGHGRKDAWIKAGILICGNLLAREDLNRFDPIEILYLLSDLLRYSYSYMGNSEILSIFSSMMIGLDRSAFGITCNYLISLTDGAFYNEIYREETERYLEEAEKEILVDGHARDLQLVRIKSAMNFSEWEKAIGYSDQLRTLMKDPDDFFYLTRAVIERNLGRVREAYEDNGRAIRLSEESLHKAPSLRGSVGINLVESYHYQSAFCIEMGEYTEATEYCCKALRLMDSLIREIPASTRRLVVMYQMVTLYAGEIPAEESNPHLGELYGLLEKVAKLFQPKKKETPPGQVVKVKASEQRGNPATARIDHIRSRIRLAGESSSDFPASYRPVVGKKLTDRLKKQALEKLDLQLNENDIVAVLAPSASLLGIGREVILFTKAGIAGTCFKRKGVIHYEEVKEVRESKEGTVAITFSDEAYEEDAFKASEVLEYIFS